MEQVLIVALTPLIIAGLKKLAVLVEQKIPVAFLPALAPLLGVAVTFLLPLLGLDPVGIETGAVLGLAGVGVREVAVKTTRALN